MSGVASESWHPYSKVVALCLLLALVWYFWDPLDDWEDPPGHVATFVVIGTALLLCAFDSLVKSTARQRLVWGETLLMIVALVWGILVAPHVAEQLAERRLQIDLRPTPLVTTIFAFVPLIVWLVPAAGALLLVTLLGSQKGTTRSRWIVVGVGAIAWVAATALLVYAMQSLSEWIADVASPSSLQAQPERRVPGQRVWLHDTGYEGGGNAQLIIYAAAAELNAKLWLVAAFFLTLASWKRVGRE